MSGKIYILLPVYNRKETTKKFVHCLKQQNYKKYHLLLIDDGSTDGTDEWVKENVLDLTVIKGTGNWWWAGSLQQGYEWLKRQVDVHPNDIVLIINDDTEFKSDFFNLAMSILENNSRQLILAQCYSSQTGKLIDAGVHVNWQKLSFTQAINQEDINCLSTRGLFMKISDFFLIGGFSPALLPHYTSDYEFTIRAQRKGMQLLTYPSLKLWVDELTTGYHSIENGSVRQIIKQLFSIKSAMNPITWTMFIAMSCPWPWKFVNWLRVWYFASCRVGQYLRKR